MIAISSFECIFFLSSFDVIAKRLTNLEPGVYQIFI